MTSLEALIAAGPPSCVVFDCDGVLLDTEAIWDRSQSAVLADHGVTLTAETQSAIVGTSLEDSAHLIASTVGIDEEQIGHELRTRFLADLEGEVPVLPGAEDVLRACAAKVPVGVASNSWHDALVDKLERTGLIDVFSTVQSTDTVPRPKPAPDMYAAAVRALGGDPARSLALEDSAIGGRAALAAGLRLLAVPSPGVRIEGAHGQVAGLEDVSLQDWIASW